MASNVKLTKAQIDFLSLLNLVTPTPRSALPLADRAADRVRQSCKRLGLAKFSDARLGTKRPPIGWLLTPAGLEALREVESR